VILESVPNFSEGRRPEVARAIADEARRAGATVLDLTWDADHHRGVLTFAGEPARVEAAAFAVAKKSLELIDLNRHQGKHPRMGALDVLPFVPLGGADLADAVAMARRVGERIGSALQCPVFLYEAAASRPERRNLATLRAPRFEGLRDLVGRDPAWAPDFGPARIHPTGGAVAVGARPPLVAFNIDLETADVAVARSIARSIRERDGGLPGVKALGLYLDQRACAQVSMNLVDIARTRVVDVYKAVERLAGQAGTSIRAGELIGLVPRAALSEEEARGLRLYEFSPARILENRLP